MVLILHFRKQRETEKYNLNYKVTTDNSLEVILHLILKSQTIFLQGGFTLLPNIDHTKTTYRKKQPKRSVLSL